MTGEASTRRLKLVAAPAASQSEPDPGPSHPCLGVVADGGLAVVPSLA
jgi:hypothetical protein